MSQSSEHGTSSGGLNTGGNLSDSSFLEVVCRLIPSCCLELLTTFKNESDMIQKFIELHDSENQPILVNESWIMSVIPNDYGGCIIKMGVIGNTTKPYLLHVIESYQTIKEML